MQTRQKFITRVVFCLTLLSAVLSSNGLAMAVSEALPASAPLVPSATNTTTRTVLTPAMAQAVLQAGWFTPEQLSQNPQVSRAEFARALVRAMGFDTIDISPFPFYRDVPANHAQYAAIEVLREKRLLVPNHHGFFGPNQIISRAEAMAAVADILTGRTLPPDEVGFLIQGFADTQTVKPTIQQTCAKLLRAQIFPNGDLNHKTLQPLAPLDTDNLAYWLVQLRERYQRDWLAAKPAEVVSHVPAGLRLKLSPTASLFAEQLPLGTTVYWVLVNAVPLPDGSNLPEGTRVRATMVATDAIPVTTNAKTPVVPSSVGLDLTDAQAPMGTKYQLHGHLNLVFPRRQGGAYIVPGEVYTVITQP
jgi:hypothetical protein